jgi:hypothetical protein
MGKQQWENNNGEKPTGAKDNGGKQRERKMTATGSAAVTNDKPGGRRWEISVRYVGWSIRD